MMEDIWPDRRLMRAQSLTVAIMQEISKVAHFQNNEMRQIQDIVLNAFYQEGVEIITDADRAMAGLPPRDTKGWTPQELWVREKVNLEKLLKPFNITVDAEDLLHGKFPK